MYRSCIITLCSHVVKNRVLFHPYHVFLFRFTGALKKGGDVKITAHPTHEQNNKDMLVGIQYVHYCSCACPLIFQEWDTEDYGVKLAVAFVMPEPATYDCAGVLDVGKLL